MEQNKEYYAFISYKREDEKWAQWLQDRLEHYKFPTNLNGRTDLPKNIRPTFRDVTDSTPGFLEKVINNALLKSEWLIVVCSPRSAKSPWVCKEAQTFIDLGRADHIIPFVIEGTPFSKAPATECYPEALLNLTGSKELLAANINEMGRDAAIVKVISRMFNVKFDSLWQRYEKEKRKRRNRILAGIAILAILALMVAGWLWHLNSQLETKNRELSIENINAGSREIIGFLKDGNYVEALHKVWDLIDIWEPDYRDMTLEFEQALRSMYRYENTDGIIKLFSIPIANDQRYLSSDTSYIYVCKTKEWQDEILRYDIETGEYKGKVFPTKSQRDTAMVMMMKGSKVLYCTSHKALQKPPTLRLCDLSAGYDVKLSEHSWNAWILTDDCVMANHATQHVGQKYSADLFWIKSGGICERDSISIPFFPSRVALKGDSLLMANNSMVATWHTKQRQWVNRITYRTDNEHRYGGLNVLALDPYSSWVANLRQRYGLVLFSTDKCDSVVISPNMMQASVAFNPSGSLMAVADVFSDSLVIYATENITPLFRLSSTYLDGVEVKFVNDNTIVAYRSGYMLSIYNVEAHFNTRLLYSPDGVYRLETSDNWETLGIVNDSTNEEIINITDIDNQFRVMGFSQHGRYLKISTGEYIYALIDTQKAGIIPVISQSEYLSPFMFIAECSSEDERTFAIIKEGFYNAKSDTLKIFDVAKNVMRDYVPGKKLNKISLNPNGTQLAMSDGTNINLLQIDSVSISPRKYSSDTSNFSVTNLSILDMCFAPDGHNMVVSYSDGSLRQWNIENGQPSSPIIRSDYSLGYSRINISPDGQYVIGTSAQKNDRWVFDVWHIATGHHVDRLTNDWAWCLKPFISTYYYSPNYQASFCSDGSPKIVINEQSLLGLSRIFEFPSLEQLIDSYIKAKNENR